MRAGRLAGVMAAAVLAVAVLAPGGLVAHGKGILKLASRELAAGDSVRLSGEKLPKRAALGVFLIGVGGRTRLTEVQTDSTGAFAGAVLVPHDLAPGAYRLVAVASDGDEVGTLDVTVGAARADGAAK